MDQRGQQADPPETRCLLGITGTGASAARYKHTVTAIHALRGAVGGHLAQLWPFASHSVLQAPLPSGDEPQVGRKKSGGAIAQKGGSSGGPRQGHREGKLWMSNRRGRKLTPRLPGKQLDFEPAARPAAWGSSAEHRSKGAERTRAREPGKGGPRGLEAEEGLAVRLRRAGPASPCRGLSQARGPRGSWSVHGEAPTPLRG